MTLNKFFKSIEEAVKDINQNFAMVRTGDSIVIMEVKNKQGQLELKPIKERALFDLYENKPILIKGKRENPVKHWKQSINRREYLEGIEFNPKLSTLGKLNLFSGYGVVPQVHGSWDELRKHILEAVCNGEDELFQYFMDWFAHAFQYPLERPETALVLVGGQGTGKSSTLDHFGRLFGDAHRYKDSDSNKIFGRFQEHLIGKQYIFWDEASLRSHRGFISRMKDLITSEHMSIEGKGKSVTTYQNITRLVMASNDMHVVNASGDERRYAIFEVSDKYQKDSEHFGKISEELENGGYERLLHDLLNWEIKSDLRNVPMTKGLHYQRIESLDPIQKWWFEGLQRGYFTCDFHSHIPWGEDVPTKVFYEAFLSNMKQISLRGQKVSDVAFGRALIKLVPSDWQLRMRESSGARQYVYQLPTIEDARAHFEQVANIIDFDWDVLDTLDSSDRIEFV